MDFAPEGLTLVLGADGFLGRNALRRLREAGRPCLGVGRDAGDFTDPAVVDRALRQASAATRILHLVTRQRTGQVQYGIQGELLATNARIHLNVLDAWRARQPQAKLISTGSSCVYPESDRPIGEGAFQSGQMHESVRGYGLAKQILAVGSETYGAQYGLRWLHLVLATVYGPHDHRAPERTHFMAGMIERAVAERRAGAETFSVWGDPGTIRDLLYVDDQLDAIFAADAAFEDRILNCSSNAPITIDGAARAIVDALGWHAAIVYPPGTFKGAAYKTIDAGEFLTRTGWSPRVGLVEGVRRTLAMDGEAIEPPEVRP